VETIDGEDWMGVICCGINHNMSKVFSRFVDADVVNKEDLEFLRYCYSSEADIGSFVCDAIEDISVHFWWAKNKINARASKIKWNGAYFPAGLTLWLFSIRILLYLPLK
jgi:hypothetical protein